MRGEQQRQEERVATRIGAVIESFCRTRLHLDMSQFRGQELHMTVALKLGRWTAPGSAGRILRHLRAKGRLDYLVVDRQASLYDVLWVAP